jgi:hypothetical protein
MCDEEENREEDTCVLQRCFPDASWTQNRIIYLRDTDSSGMTAEKIQFSERARGGGMTET